MYRLIVIQAMSIFSSLKAYAGKWEVSDSREFTQEEMDLIKSTEVVESTYGLSVKFIRKDGQLNFIPLANDSSLSIGDSLDMAKATVLTLSKQGEVDIYRVKE